MKTSFAKPASKPATKPVATAKPAPEIVEEETSESTLAVRETGSEVAMPIQGLDGQIQGEFSRRDLTIPKLNLVNKTGELSNTFPAGSFLYNREVVIGDGKKPCQITITRMAKFYLQDLPYGSGEMPKNFSTLRAVS